MLHMMASYGITGPPNTWRLSLVSEDLFVSHKTHESPSLGNALASALVNSSSDTSAAKQSSIIENRYFKSKICTCEWHCRSC